MKTRKGGAAPMETTNLTPITIDPKVSRSQLWENYIISLRKQVNQNELPHTNVHWTK